MKKKYPNVIGKTYGRLTITKETRPLSSRQRGVEAVCECGNIKEYRLGNILRGNTVSCGCYNLEQHKTHGMTGTNAHNTWKWMIGRCKSNKQYIANGIVFCDRWKIFENFFEDMGEPPKGLTLDRIDTLGNYEKDNCRWATHKTQARNTTGHKNTSSRYKGVTRIKQKRDRPWIAQISMNGNHKYLGVYSSEHDAAVAYNKEAIKYEGTRLNEVQS